MVNDPRYFYLLSKYKVIRFRTKVMLEIIRITLLLKSEFIFSIKSPL